MDRRSSLKALGALVGGTSFPRSLHARDEFGEPLILPDPGRTFSPARPGTAITCGAGARGNVYGNFAVEYPNELNLMGFAAEQSRLQGTVELVRV